MGLLQLDASAPRLTKRKLLHLLTMGSRTVPRPSTGDESARQVPQMGHHAGDCQARTFARGPRN